MKSFLAHGHARITFTGGTNVTLRGSTDPKWGWIDGHGQPVRERFNSLRLKSVFHWILDIGYCSGGMPFNKRIGLMGLRSKRSKAVLSGT